MDSTVEQKGLDLIADGKSDPESRFEFPPSDINFKNGVSQRPIEEDLQSSESDNQRKSFTELNHNPLETEQHAFNYGFASNSYL